MVKVLIFHQGKFISSIVRMILSALEYSQEGECNLIHKAIEEVRSYVKLA
ncbi:MAG: hypothetical protein ACMUIA_11535 [bacterium]